ncbi:MAG: DUF1736 domain-containing protein [Saprospiraceae bacterium]|nr:DUF1736 domain-containing protein [Saprospiraceae bacterium]
MAKINKPKVQAIVPRVKAGPDIDKIVISILFVLSGLFYVNTLNHDFVLDDALAIELNENVTQGFSGIIDIIKGGYRENNFGGKLYRPVSLIQFATEWAVSPRNPFIHHFFNVFWFACCVVLIYIVVRQWFNDKNILLPLSIAALFAVHPIHTEVVANIKSRDEIMSVFFIMGSFVCWNRYLSKHKPIFFALALASYFLGLLSKESAVTMFPVFGLIAWFIYHETFLKSVIKALIFVIPVCIIFIIRYAIFGSSPAIPVDIMDNPIVSASDSVIHLATSLFILGKYFLLQIFPWPLSSDYSYQVIPLKGFSDLRVWVSLIIYLGLIVLAIVGLKNRRFVSMCMLAYLMAISLYSQIPVVIGTMFAERLAFLPSFWLLSGILFLLLEVIKADVETPFKHISELSIRTKISVAVITVIVTIFGFSTIMRNLDWKNNLSLFTSDSNTYPQSVRLHNGAAEQLVKASSAPGLSQKEMDELMLKAENHCQEILKIRPVATAYLTLGNIRLKQSRYEEAVLFYDKVNDLKDLVDVNKALAFREIGRNAGEKEQNFTKASEFLNKSLLLNNNDAETWFLMGVLYGVQNDHQKAAENFEKAFTIKPGPEYAKYLVTAYKNLGNTAKVDEYQKYIK